MKLARDPTLWEVFASAVCVSASGVFTLAFIALSGYGLFNDGPTALAIVVVVFLVGSISAMIILPLWRLLIRRKPLALFTTIATAISVVASIGIGVVLGYWDSIDAGFVGVGLSVGAGLVGGIVAKYTLPSVFPEGYCPQCDYDLRGVPGSCPECGWNRPENEGQGSSPRE